MKKEPFFSVIIPAYNCRATIEPLLDSIIEQRLDKDDIQVIICDDKSTDNFIELVKPYTEILNIIFTTTTREVHCPGNTREAALRKCATGDWVTFIDNDDMFEPGAFRQVKEYIESKNSKYIVCTDFREWLPSSNTYGREFIGSDADTWLHGKFYNRKNLLEKFNIHFKDDLFSHEDVFFNSTVLGNLIGIDEDYDYYHVYTYKWVANPQSLSRSYFNTDHYYIETYLNDYIISTSEPFYNALKTYPEKKAFYVHQLMMAILHSFFYFDASRYRLGSNIISDNLKHLHDFKNELCKQLEVDQNFIIGYIYQDPDLYDRVKSDSENGAGKFIETQSFHDFIMTI